MKHEEHEAAAISHCLDAIKENRKTVVISYSISQIIDSDVIYVLKEGRVVEIGTHDELYDKVGRILRFSMHRPAA